MNSHRILDLLRGALVSYGYCTVGVALLLENAGLPVPGETFLLLASFLAYSRHDLRLSWIIIVAIAAAAIGDNLGYVFGQYWGRPLLDHYRHSLIIGEAAVLRGEQLFQRYGAITVLFARFVFALRVIAGPMAGVLRMPWKKFVAFNLMGAALWVISISLTGYFFGNQWNRLTLLIKRLDLMIAVAVLLGLLLAWWRTRKGRLSLNGS